MLHRLLSIHCLSPLHCGTGQGIAGIDLPVQRERHTGWPVMPGSSIKGVLRDAARQATGKKPEEANSDADVIALFGPEPRAEQSGELGLGALSFGDGVVVAFPVRSLCGVFAWVTCPMALQRLARIAGLAGLDAKSLAGEASGTDGIRCAAALAVDGEKKQVLLEDQALQRSELPPALVSALTALFPLTAQPLVADHLAIVHDDVFTWFARHATQVEARIALDPATKTVADGALFYQETVPPETLLVALIGAEDARHAKAKVSQHHTDTAALAHLHTLCCTPRQFGGDATIGKGLCALALIGK